MIEAKFIVRNIIFELQVNYDLFSKLNLRGDFDHAYI